MKPKLTNFIAYPSQRNTPETDAQKLVLHTVEFTENGRSRKTTLLANCPMEAIHKVQERHYDTG